MAVNRADKSGINADMVKKLEENYPHEEEAKVRGWIRELTGEELEAGDGFWAAVKDGSLLCRVLNTLHPELIPKKFEKPAVGNFKQVETVDYFLKGCRAYGMAEKDLFVTLDLQELQNKNMVISTLVSLGRTAQRNNYDGPTIGPRQAVPNPREFTEEQYQQGKSIVSLQMGTNKVASQEGMTPFGKERQIADTRVINT